MRERNFTTETQNMQKEIDFKVNKSCTVQKKSSSLNDGSFIQNFRQYILTQRANATVDCFANSVRLVHVFT